MAMRRGLKAAVLAAILAGSLGALTARADVYVWTDAAGVTNVSNLPPPEGSRRVSVTRTAPRDAAQEAASREAARQAEMRALDERMRQLEADAEQARREAAQALAAAQPRHAPAPAAPPVVVVVAPSAQAPAYAPPMGPCDYTWGNCGWGSWPGFFSPGLVVVSDDRRRSHHHSHHRPHHRPAHHERPWHAGAITVPPPVHPFPFPKPVHWRK